MRSKLKWILFSVVVILASCISKKMESQSEFLPGKRISELKAKELKEVSGLASSAKNPGLFWAHNDRGNDPKVYLIDSNCEIIQTFELKGIKNRDWEDIAVSSGPDSTKTYVYIGDIGDNDGVHSLKYVYRFEEPAVDLNNKKQSISDFETIVFRLPGSRQMDSEALFIDFQTHDLYIVTKREHPVHVYRLGYPYASGDTLTVEETAALPLTEIVAADLTPDGSGLLMKNYSHIYYWKNAQGKSLSDLLKEAPEEVPYDPEPQGESIAWARDRSGFYTISEVARGYKSYLYFYERK